MPNVMYGTPSRQRSAGFGVSRGRLPGATTFGIAGSRLACDPRSEMWSPSPGITAPLPYPSLGVAENALP